MMVTQEVADQPHKTSIVNSGLICARDTFFHSNNKAPRIGGYKSETFTY